MYVYVKRFNIFTWFKIVFGMVFFLHIWWWYDFSMQDSSRFTFFKRLFNLIDLGLSSSSWLVEQTVLPIDFATTKLR